MVAVELPNINLTNKLAFRQTPITPAVLHNAADAMAALFAAARPAAFRAFPYAVPRTASRIARRPISTLPTNPHIDPLTLLMSFKSE